jgi:hypothetical protein
MWLYISYLLFNLPNGLQIGRYLPRNGIARGIYYLSNLNATYCELISPAISAQNGLNRKTF